MIIQTFLGWPAIVGFTVLATIGAWKPSKTLMATALAWCLPSAFYLFGGNGWIQVFALYMPISLGASIYFIDRKIRIVPKLLLVPIYGGYIWLGYAVLSQ